MEVEPEKYNLSKQIKLKEINNNEIAIVKKIKSRIIQKDAIKIIEIAEKIKKIEPNVNVSLICSSNICSKSKNLLETNRIEIKIEE